MKLEYQLLMDVYKEEVKRELRNEDRRYLADANRFRRIKHYVRLMKISIRFGKLGYRLFEMRKPNDFSLMLMVKIFRECYATRWE